VGGGKLDGVDLDLLP